CRPSCPALAQGRNLLRPRAVLRPRCCNRYAWSSSTLGAIDALRRPRPGAPPAEGGARRMPSPLRFVPMLQARYTCFKRGTCLKQRPLQPSAVALGETGDLAPHLPRGLADHVELPPLLVFAEHVAGNAGREAALRRECDLVQREVAAGGVDAALQLVYR